MSRWRGDGARLDPIRRQGSPPRPCGPIGKLLPQGCASSEQIREKQAAAQATQDQEDDARCRASGAPGTPAYQDCRTRLVQKRAEDQAAQERRREAFQKTTAEGTSALSGH